MNALSKAHRAYGAPAAPTRTPRSVEYDAVARVTRRLRTAEAAGPGSFPEMVAALHDNRALWTTFAADVADAANALPPDLRARLFYLAEFTRAHTSRVLARQAGAGPLVEINTAILQGLRGGVA